MRDINLFEGIKKSAPQKTAPKGSSFGLVLLILCAVVLGGFYGYLKYTETTLDEQIASISQNIATVQGSTAGKGTPNEKQNQMSAIAAYNTALMGFQKDMQAYPKLNLALLNDISKRLPADVTVIAVNYQKGVLTLSGNAVNPDSAANFAAALKLSTYFDFVYYKGSNYQPPASGAAAGFYQFAVNCLLKGGAEQ